jgi:hypothetical protein
MTGVLYFAAGTSITLFSALTVGFGVGAVVLALVGGSFGKAAKKGNP